MDERLNVLQITTHDSGRHFGCYGHATLDTPRIDALADDGVRLSNYFAVVPICCASRATQLTGRYPQSHGLMDLCFAPFNWRLNDDERHLSHVLRDAGYRSMLFGMQHEVAVPELDRLAFHERRAEGHKSCHDVAAEVARFLAGEAAGVSPFYAQIGFFETHTPFDRGGVKPDTSKGLELPPYVADDDPVARAAMAGFQGSVREVDRAVGAILDALDAAGLAENTLVVFTTDHGIELPRAKWHLYDPGVAIGLVARCPAAGLVGGRVCGQLHSNVDYLPTVLDLLGLPVDGRVQGVSAADAWRGASDAPVRDAVFGLYHKANTRSVRTGRYKLIRHFDAPLDYHRVPVRYPDLLMRRGLRPVELYDLEADPCELDNLDGSPELADVQADLDGRLWTWLESVADPILAGPVRSPSYDAALADYASWRADE